MAIQDNWRWCNKCQALAFAGNGSLGACPAGGQHNDTGSGDHVLAQVGDCSPLLKQVKSLEQQIKAIQSSPGFIQDKNGPHPGKPDPVDLAEVRALEQQLGKAESKYNACQEANAEKVL